MFDLHNHMLPRMDDGAPDWSHSLAMARMAVEDGIEGVVCTPHWVNGLFENTRPIILSRVEELRSKLEEEKIPLKVYPGAELRLDFDLPHRIESQQVLTLNDTGRYALVELPEDVVPRNMANFFWEMQAQGTIPVLAHPERNRVLIRHPMRLYKWVEMGILTQLTAASLEGKFGREIHKFSVWLLKHRMVHVLATDSHGPKSRAPKLTEALKEVEKVLDGHLAHAMVFDIPDRIIRGEHVSVPDPLKPKSRSFDSSPLKKFFSFLGLRSG